MTCVEAPRAVSSTASQPDAAAVRCPAALEAGRGAGGRKALGRHLAPAQRTVEEQPHDRAVDQAAALGRLLPLEAAAGPSPLRAGCEDGGALVGRQPPGLSAAGGGDFGAAEVFEGLASERPAGRR